ncbi:hypothetical protein M433DRAFT_148668 [Acidomyces richmondensis BFW]|nr:MAG: hypothetical protein FE78DRAFT_87095 [Acidomyces sp. 'richmondensis']KYG50723.1 hypothetical protein M433DRAFT_148668 [Acidomyces richmondensis BFW]
MARYPTFEEYLPRRNFLEGIQRCDALIARQPYDLRLQATKLRLLAASNQHAAAQALLSHLAATPTPNIPDIPDLVLLEEGALELHRHTFPPPLTLGREVSALWDRAARTTRKLDVLLARWERAVADSRTEDMQQTLIQLKAADPGNRVFYMAHAAVTQMLSTHNGDLQARLALSLAKKAVAEGFDGDKDLDCRVVGKIFELQGVGVEEVNGRKTFGDAGVKLQGANMDAQKTVVGEVPDPKEVPANEWLEAEVRRLENEFGALLTDSKNVGRQAFVDFAATCMHLFHHSLTALRSSTPSQHPTSLAILAIAALVHLFTTTHSSPTTVLLPAAYLAKCLLPHSPTPHIARILLIHLTTRLNLARLSLPAFDSLSIKEIQYETLAHFLFTRLSLLHPHPTLLAPTHAWDPAKRIRSAFDVYLRCESQLSSAAAAVLRTGQTGLLFDLQTLRARLRDSRARRIFVLESRRVGRLIKGAAGWHEAMETMGPPVVANWVRDDADSRDFSAVGGTWGEQVEKSLHGTSTGVVPGRVWILYALLADSVWALSHDAEPLVVDGEVLLAAVSEVATTTGREDGEECDARPAEQLAGIVAFHTYRLLIYPFPPSSPSTEATEPIISEISASLSRLPIHTLVSNDGAEPLADHLLDAYAFADASRNVIAACRWLAAHRQIGRPESLQALQAQAEEAFAAIQRHAKSQAGLATAKRVKEVVIGMENGYERLWTELRKLGGEGGEEGLDRFCADVAEAAREGWEGVGRIRGA